MRARPARGTKACQPSSRPRPNRIHHTSPTGTAKTALQIAPRNLHLLPITHSSRYFLPTCTSSITQPQKWFSLITTSVSLFRSTLRNVGSHVPDVFHSWLESWNNMIPPLLEFKFVNRVLNEHKFPGKPTRQINVSSAAWLVRRWYHRWDKWRPYPETQGVIDTYIV